MSHFICGLCRETLETKGNEDEMRAEYEDNFPGCDFDTDKVRVCDPCYRIVMGLPSAEVQS